MSGALARIAGSKSGTIITIKHAAATTISDYTQEGQASMPKKPRSTQHKRRRVVTVDTKKWKLLKPDPAAEMGSLRKLFEGKTSKEIIEEARKEDD